MKTKEVALILPGEEEHTALYARRANARAEPPLVGVENPVWIRLADRHPATSALAKPNQLRRRNNFTSERIHNAAKPLPVFVTQG